MIFTIRSLTTSYNDRDVENINVSYRGNNNERTINFNGRFDVRPEDYQGNESIDKLEELSKQNFLSKLEEIPIEIKSINMVYERESIRNVQVVFNSRNQDRDLSINGNFNLSEEEYENNSSFDQLEAYAKSYLRSESEEVNEAE